MKNIETHNNCTSNERHNINNPINGFYFISMVSNNDNKEDKSLFYY